MTNAEATAVHAIVVTPNDGLVFLDGRATMTLTNPSSADCVAFSVRPSAAYKVEPNHGVLKPAGGIALLVTPLDATRHPRDDLTVQSVGVEASYCRALQAQAAPDAMHALIQLWANVEMDHVTSYRVFVQKRPSMRLDTIITPVVDPTATHVESISFVLSPESPVTILVRNPSARDSVTFQVMASQLKRYHVRPNHGVLGPMSQIRVQMLLKPAYCDKLLRATPTTRGLLKDKILVQALTLSPDFCRQLTKKASKEVIDDLTTLWIRAEKKRIVTKKLRCRFELTAGGPMTWHLALTPSMDFAPAVEGGDDENDVVVKKGSHRAPPPPAKYCDCEIM
ncbi:hypothetical protein SPRG_09867 [Saprolegnia parasitica CBS 223.65]|uniref:MSP domain-containing protein n=1 Tax=Saprolegnia parasitica (strain CBS 223.65) TaxID=695850 RepID=A0A067CCI4_SAPPC|nr:hypothetical protein SPRG_09867 [Saprolegnia parasitica CBS 223.65]KDO24231.1 hypothetical protein SPRG_09867 [Saprolegnia parasitica CBS 223.65]|eukprot:XP_012205007.1 hypothetical protein SPRG_09867 [Saprolegnia parasitica CBS 223.65]